MHRSLIFFLLIAGCETPEAEKPDDTAAVNNVVAVDEDGDGFLVSEGDCDDNNAGAYPDAPELCDGLDNDCDTLVDEDVATLYYIDADGDGFGDETTAKGYCEPPVGLTLVAGDCDDTDPAFHPDADEPCTEDVDYNCDGEIAYADDDADTWAACEDCDDLDPAVNPDATEICNGIDDDCDGEADPTSSFDVLPFYEDRDDDGYGNVDVRTDACAAPDGYVADTTDCDDARADVNPAATERCDDINTDEDCDGTADDADTSVDTTTFQAWYADSDSDGFGPDSSLVMQCDAPAGFIAVGGDCNDASDNFFPGAPETDCSDPNDYNCDGSVAYVDADGDLWAACVECDDGNPAVNPAATELCNGIDDDCDGVTDPDSASGSLTWYADTDGDTYGDPAASAPGCTAPAGYVADSTDCDDTNDMVNPAGIELCNGIDDDCDGMIDPPSAFDALTWYADADGDTYGDPAGPTLSCDLPAGFVADASDCDDTAATVYPGATEYCNGVDDDCDGVIDPDSAYDALSWYADADGDTYGDAATTTLACSQPADFVADDTDCDDTRADVNPGAPEVCDAAYTDENCNGLADDDDPTTEASSMGTWYTDADGDTYGDPASSFTGCLAPVGMVTDYTDCDDTRSGVNPVATEYCDALDDDEDCDGLADDDDPSVSASTYDTWYIDGDGDGYGGTTTTDACDVPAGYIAADGDCDDADAAVNPSASEVCDGVDNDCEGTVDESGGASLCSEDYVLFVTSSFLGAASSTWITNRAAGDAYCTTYAASAGIAGSDFRIVYSTSSEDAKDYLDYDSASGDRVYDRYGTRVDGGDLWGSGRVTLPDMRSWTITGTNSSGEHTSCSGSYPDGSWPICQYCSQKFACGSSTDDPFAPGACCWTGTRAIVCMGVQ